VVNGVVEEEDGVSSCQYDVFIGRGRRALVVDILVR